MLIPQYFDKFLGKTSTKLYVKVKQFYILELFDLFENVLALLS